MLAVLVAAAVLLPAPASADSVRNEQWQLGALNALAAWQHATGKGVVVAVLDSGVDASHPDLAGQVLPGVDLVDGTSDGRTDPVGHGTTVASLIAGRRDDAGVVGIAPDAKILPVRVLDRNNRYEDASVVARGLRWAVDNGAHVVNLSLGGFAYSDVLANALAYAAERDVVVVACTGNLAQSTGERQVWYPAREPGVLAVAGLRNPTVQQSAAGWLDRSAAQAGSDDLWTGSLTGPQTILSAPAVGLTGAKPSGYWRVQGTSFAAPLVTGAAALVRSKDPTLSAANAVNRLIRTASDLGAPGRDDRYGYGLVNPLAALTAELSPVTTNPLVDVAEAAGQAGAGNGDPATLRSDRSGGADGGTLTDNTGAGRTNASAKRAGSYSVTGTAPPLTLALMLLLAVLAAFPGNRRFADRYLRRARHAK